MGAAGAAIFLLVGLAGCDQAGTSDGGADSLASATAAMAGQTTELVQRDVEAPDVFQVTEAGLWDGRPSLGGVWVAHPDVVDPERVIIRNTANGQFVIGALFRRERDNPGPALQVSSDAADALGILAGAPTELNVTALRREDPPPPPETAEPTPATDPTQPDPAALAAATTPDTAPEITATPLDGAPTTSPALDAAAAATSPTGGSADSQALIAQALNAITTAQGGTAASVETTALSPAPAAEPAPAPAPSAGGLERAFIQIGIFSVEANARGAAADLDAKGLPTRVVGGESQGSAFWRVLVGPAGSEAQRADYLDRVKAEGFADAYFVRD